MAYSAPRSEFYSAMEKWLRGPAYWTSRAMFVSRTAGVAWLGRRMVVVLMAMIHGKYLLVVGTYYIVCRYVSAWASSIVYARAGRGRGRQAGEAGNVVREHSKAVLVYTRHVRMYPHISTGRCLVGSVVVVD